MALRNGTRTYGHGNLKIIRRSSHQKITPQPTKVRGFGGATKANKMKNQLKFAIVLSIALGLISAKLTAQSDIGRDASGDFFQVKKPTAVHDSSTTFIYTDFKGNKFPVYQGKKGAYYIRPVSSRTNKPYRKYLPKQ